MSTRYYIWIKKIGGSVSVGNWKNRSLMRPGRVAAGRFVDGRRVRTILQNVDTNLCLYVSRRDLLKAALGAPFSRTACIGKIETVAGETPKRRLWLASNQSENCFSAPRSRPARRQAGQLNFLLFRFACSPSVYCRCRRRAPTFSVVFCEDCGRLHAMATEQSTSDAYESGVYGVLRAEIMRRKTTVKMATLTTENYCWILRKWRTTEDEKHAIIAT